MRDSPEIRAHRRNWATGAERTATILSAVQVVHQPVMISAHIARSLLQNPDFVARPVQKFFPAYSFPPPESGSKASGPGTAIH